MWISRGDVTNGNHSATSMSVVEWCCVWLGYSLTSRIDILIRYLSFGCQEECILCVPTGQDGYSRLTDQMLVTIKKWYLIRFIVWLFFSNSICTLFMVQNESWHDKQIRDLYIRYFRRSVFRQRFGDHEDHQYLGIMRSTNTCLQVGIPLT
jgi:hypothetical protein